MVNLLVLLKLILNLPLIYIFFIFFIIFNNYFFIIIKYSLSNFFIFFMSKFYYQSAVFFDLFFISNLDFFLFLNVSILFIYFYINNFFSKIVPLKSQSNIESFLNFIAQMIFSQNGFYGQKFFVFFVILFLFIFISNFLGMLPFSFTITSHIFQTFALGAGVIISITILAVSRNGYRWLKFFFPDLPIFILPLFSFIEVISYISRAFSLSIRLFANLMSGHTLLHILTGFILKIGSKNIFFFFIAIIPFILISAIIFLEIVIAILQAYVFVNLFAIYLKDAYNFSH
jgi:F-type H+-transporting ATPase subunit a